MIRWPVSFRIDLRALGQARDYPTFTEITPKAMDKVSRYHNFMKHKNPSWRTAQHNNNVNITSKRRRDVVLP